MLTDLPYLTIDKKLEYFPRFGGYLFSEVNSNRYLLKTSNENVISLTNTDFYVVR